MSWTDDEYDRALGSIMGGAVGDALGYPVEFWGWKQLTKHGTVRELTDEGLISDDTQMTLFAMDAAPYPATREEFQAKVAGSYYDWYCTQVLERPVAETTGLLSYEWLYERRAPGDSCIGALSTMLRRTDTPIPATPGRGCGTVMRAAPFGLAATTAEQAYSWGVWQAGITHADPSAQRAAGATAELIFRIRRGEPLGVAVGNILRRIGRTPDRALYDLLDNAISGAAERTNNIRWASWVLGEGWDATEALALSVWAALSNPDDFEAAVTVAVNHPGDSDSTGAITGNIMGALLGTKAIPQRWLDKLEHRQRIVTEGARFGIYASRMLDGL